MKARKLRRGEVEEYVDLDDEDKDPDYNPTKDPEREFEEEDTYLDDEETFEIEKHVHAINLQEAGDYVVEIRRFVSCFAKVVKEGKNRRCKRVQETYTLHERDGFENRMLWTN